MTAPHTGASVFMAPDFEVLVEEAAALVALATTDSMLLVPCLASLLIELMADRALLRASPVAVAATLLKLAMALEASRVAVKIAPDARLEAVERAPAASEVAVENAPTASDVPVEIAPLT
ncbi:hypothetical protein M430DRAFT_32261 [Amorphotheca resinae ATCC 22711]|uniref:Uncharacterized protein n=1 Tax=Amorphotheca resinae ATCC 22711 TaxID=857342 RepID=A0A2T3BDV7_AMORE|nr:hypothetical protein M430DRAFT_32261 [Amorphotheca resinae ATCC 22711]PSS27576.1 hypothetical protein M430DRAFT_32261 [Amorphotheca resinae ATCC 22711]